MAATRWGIVSAGGISNDFCASIRGLPREEHEILGVAARSLERAQEFAKKFDIQNAYNSYEELAKNADIEVVYIGTINTAHHEMSMLMLNAGKHVICEKPICMNTAQTRQVFDLAKQKGLFIVEGLWSRHFPMYKKLNEVIAAGCIGDIKMVDARFGFRMLDRERITSKELGGGALYDVGIYPLQLAVMLLGRKPEKIVASGTVSPNGVDECVCLNLHYSGGRIARLMCHADAHVDNLPPYMERRATLTYRSLNFAAFTPMLKPLESFMTNCIIPFFWCPSVLETPKEKFEVPLPTLQHEVVYPRSEGLLYEVQAVRDSLLKGELEHPLLPAAESIAISEIIEEALRQVRL